MTFVIAIGAAVCAVPQERRGLATGIVTAGGSFGQFLLVPIAQGLIGSIGWREALLIYAALAATMVLLAIGIAGRPATQAATNAPMQGFVGASPGIIDEPYRDAENNS